MEERAARLGFVVSAMSFLIGVLAVVFKLADVYVVPGWASVVVCMAFLGGVQLTVLGVMGEYIARIHDEVKRRPLYLVRDQLGVDDSDVPAPTVRPSSKPLVVG